MSDSPKYAFAVAVVGSKDVMSADELAALLDLLVNRHTQDRRIVLLSPGGSPASDWARGRRHSVFVLPECGNAVRQDYALAAEADAVVVLGDPGPWERLIRLAREAGTPVRVFRVRPRIPLGETPAWELPAG